MRPIAYSRRMRAAALAILLGGCLIVRTTEDPIEEPCPDTEPELIAQGGRPFVVAGGSIYFQGLNGLLSVVDAGGGVPSELTTSPLDAIRFAADAEHLYWSTYTGVILKKPLVGGGAVVLSEGHDNVTQLLVTPEHVVWASRGGLARWRKADETLAVLDAADTIFGLDAIGEVLYYSDQRTGIVRRSDPLLDLAQLVNAGPLVVSQGNVYVYEAGDFVTSAFAGSIRLVPLDGGEPVTTAGDLPLITDITADDNSLYFVSVLNAEYRVKQVSRFGGTVRTLGCGSFEQQQPIYLSIEAGHLFWSDGAGLYRLDPLALAAN